MAWYLQFALSPRRFTTIAIVIAIIPLLGWWITGLTDLDEGFYAAVVAEMNRRGEWITPYYNGHPWFEKPILLYWLAKPSLSLFGDMIGPRLPSVLSAIGCYLLCTWYARKRLSEQAATWTVLILGSSLIFVAYGRLMMTDMVLTLAFTGAMLTFWESLVGDKRWRLSTAALLGLAALAKGPVALLFFILIAGWTFAREKDLRPAFRGYWLLGIVLLAAVSGSWYLAAYKANGNEFVQKFLIEQNLNRFKGGDDAHTLKEFWAYFLYAPIILFGMMPWTLWLRRAWPQRNQPLKENESEQDRAFLRFLASWSVVIFLFFTVAGAKLPHYILPVVLPIALLLGAHLAEKWPDFRQVKFAYPVALVLMIAAIVNVGFYTHYVTSGQAEAHELARYIRANSIDIIPRTVATFRMGKLDKDKGTGKLDLKPTTLPSLLLYLDSSVNETNEVKKVVSENSHWLLTRSGRITEEVRAEFLSEGKELRPIGPTEKHFELYEVVSAS